MYLPTISSRFKQKYHIKYVFLLSASLLKFVQNCNSKFLRFFFWLNLTYPSTALCSRCDFTYHFLCRLENILRHYRNDFTLSNDFDTFGSLVPFLYHCFCLISWHYFEHTSLGPYQLHFIQNKTPLQSVPMPNTTLQPVLHTYIYTTSAVMIMTGKPILHSWLAFLSYVDNHMLTSKVTLPCWIH